MPALKIRDFDLDVKADAGTGVFRGYASVFDVVDADGEVVVRGAFRQSLNELAAKGRKLPVLWQHNTREPLGVYPTVREDSRGLYVEGNLLLTVTKAREAAALVEAGAVTGLSIGFREREARPDGSKRLLLNLDLKEISLVTMPANDEARVMRAEEVHSKAEFEGMLRDLGFSKAAASRLSAGGWPALAGGSPGHSELARRVLAAAETLRTRP